MVRLQAREGPGGLRVSFRRGKIETFFAIGRGLMLKVRFIE